MFKFCNDLVCSCFYFSTDRTRDECAPFLATQRGESNLIENDTISGLIFDVTFPYAVKSQRHTTTVATLGEGGGIQNNPKVHVENEFQKPERLPLLCRRKNSRTALAQLYIPYKNDMNDQNL